MSRAYCRGPNRGSFLRYRFPRLAAPRRGWSAWGSAGRIVPNPWRRKVRHRCSQGHGSTRRALNCILRGPCPRTGVAPRHTRFLALRALQPSNRQAAREDPARAHSGAHSMEQRDDTRAERRPGRRKGWRAGGSARAPGPTPAPESPRTGPQPATSPAARAPRAGPARATCSRPPAAQPRRVVGPPNPQETARSRGPRTAPGSRSRRARAGDRSARSEE